MASVSKNEEITDAPGIEGHGMLRKYIWGRGRSNLVVRGPEFNFSFAYTQKKKTETRNHPPLDFRISPQYQPFRGSYDKMQEGHGGDQADSRDRMGYDLLNFTPQYEYYNEYIRNCIVRYQIRKYGGAYGEQAIFAHNPPLTMDRTPISEANLLTKYVNGTLECFLFPNYPDFYYNNLSQYFPQYFPRDRRAPYLKFRDLFRIDLGTHINLSPFIYTSQVTDEEIESRGEQSFRTANAITKNPN